MAIYLRKYYSQLPAEILSSKATPEAIRQAFVEYLSRQVPSHGKWEYMVQEYTDDPALGKDLKLTAQKAVTEGSIRYAFAHVKDHGVTYFCKVDHPRQLRALLAASPSSGRQKGRVQVHELSPPLVGMNILLNSTRQFQEQVKHHQTPDPFGIYTIDLDAAFGELPDDINFGTTLRSIDTSKGLYLVIERLPSFGVRVDPLADLAIHVLSITSVSFLIESYRTGAAVLFYKPPTDIGNIRILNVGSMTELETETKSHPWFGTNGPHERTVEPLLPLAEAIEADNRGST